MADIFKDNVYIITGSAGGLGRAFAEQLLTRGAKVCISDIKVTIGLTARGPRSASQT